MPSTTDPLADSRASPQSPRSIPTANLNNLSLLSESSTGSWERGRMAGNARSPPTNSILADSLAAGVAPVAAGVNVVEGGNDLSPSSGAKSLRSGGAYPQPQRPWPADKGLSRPNPATGRVSFPSVPQYARQAREGYGFRPRSGQTTPTTGAEASLTYPFPSTSSSRVPRPKEDDDDLDHRPDGKSMDELRDEVREELDKQGLVQAAKGVVEPHMGISGIADEEGLGWPGKYPSVIFMKPPKN